MAMEREGLVEIPVEKAWGWISSGVDCRLDLWLLRMEFGVRQYIHMRSIHWTCDSY